jgi:hypothetical protein
MKRNFKEAKVMAKSKVSSKDTPRQEVVQPIPPDKEMNIIIKVEADGTVVYQRLVHLSTM